MEGALLQKYVGFIEKDGVSFISALNDQGQLRFKLLHRYA